VGKATSVRKRNSKAGNNGQESNQAIHEQILRAILNHSIWPGEKIDPQKLALQMGVSQTPLREALSKLVLPGYVVHLPNKGYYVTEVDGRLAADLYDLRLLLEVWCVEHIKRELIAEALPVIEKAALGFREAVENNHSLEIFLENSRFHVAVASLCGNKVLVSLLSQIFEFLTLRRIMSAPRYQEGVRRSKEHQTIIRSLKQHKLIETRKHLVNHLKGLKPVFVDSPGSSETIKGVLKQDSQRSISLGINPQSLAASRGR